MQCKMPMPVAIACGHCLLPMPIACCSLPCPVVIAHVCRFIRMFRCLPFLVDDTGRLGQPLHLLLLCNQQWPPSVALRSQPPRQEKHLLRPSLWKARNWAVASARCLASSSTSATTPRRPPRRRRRIVSSHACNTCPYPCRCTFAASFILIIQVHLCSIMYTHLHPHAPLQHHSLI